MATAGTKLQLKFGTASGVKTWTFNYAKADASTASIRTLADTMIANGSIYKNPPLTKESAELITTKVEQIELVD